MSASSVRDLEYAAKAQFVRAQKAEQKAEDIQHALNLMLNLGFERIHTALTMDGAVHEFDFGEPQPTVAGDSSPTKSSAIRLATVNLINSDQSAKV